MKAPKRNRKAQRKGLRYNEMRKRLARGEPLLPEQLATLESIVHGPPRKSAVAKTGPRFVPNVNQLAKALGCSRQLLAYHNKQGNAPKPREDGRHDVSAWRSYLSAAGRLPTAARMGERQRIVRLKCEQLALVNRRLRSQLASLERLHVPLAGVLESAQDLEQRIREIVSRIHLCAPSVVGLTVPEAEERLKQCEDELMHAFHTLGVKGE